MADKYEIKRTSRDSAVVDLVVLGSKPHTRSVLVATEVNNPHDTEASIKMNLLHQRKRAGEQWENLPVESLSKLKSGGVARFTLDSARTRKLFHHLSHLYEAKRQKGILPGKSTVVVGSPEEMVLAPASRVVLLRKLAESPDDLWKALEEASPELLRQLVYSKLHEERATALAMFKAHLERDDPEDWWQNFFQHNT